MLSVRSLTAASFILASASIASAQIYRPAGVVVMGAPDRWDYTVVDSNSGRVYVSHGDRVTAVDGRSGMIVGELSGIPGGTHGIAFSQATGQGFTDDGAAGVAVAFDLATFQIKKYIPARPDADGIVAEKTSGHIFVVEGDPASVTVIDPVTDAAIATIAVGEELEYAASDDRGSIYVAGKAKGDLVKIDTRTNQVVAHWPAADCRSPHGVAIDRDRGWVFMGCVNSELILMDDKTGRVLQKLPIGRGNDAVAFDPVRHRIFSSNGLDGTISVFEESSDGLKAIGTVETKVSGRTMAVDPVSGRLFVPAADPEAMPTSGGKPKPKPGSFRLLMFDSVAP